MSAPDITVLNRLLHYVAIPDYHKDPESRPSQEIFEVFTGEHLVNVPKGTEDDALAAIARARAAEVEWRHRSVKERAKIIGRVPDLMWAHKDELLDIIQAETGKVRRHALEELLDVSLTARYYSRNSEKYLNPVRKQGMFPVLTKATVHYQPKGVVGVIVPWNYPFTLGVTDALAALIAGNGIVLKPASITPLSALAAAELLYAAGVPRDLYQIVTGSGGVVGETIANNTDYLMFTGSSKVGALLASQMGSRVVGLSAELGGKNPMIITKGANLDKAIDVALRVFFSNAGQLCISVERLFVEREIVPELERRMVERFSRIKLAADYSYESEMGSLISQEQLDKVIEHVEDAVKKGARVLVGGKARPDIGPLFYEPTILTDVPASATVAEHETFGPVVSLYPVDNVEEAISRANSTAYGLNSSVFADSDKQGEEIAKQLRTGTVCVNEGYVTGWGSTDAPMGGMGISGLGRRHSKDGLLKYTEPQTITVQRVMDFGGPRFLPPVLWQKILPIAVRLMKYLPGR